MRRSIIALYGCTVVGVGLAFLSFHIWWSNKPSFRTEYPASIRPPSPSPSVSPSPPVLAPPLAPPSPAPPVSPSQKAESAPAVVAINEGIKRMAEASRSEPDQMSGKIKNSGEVLKKLPEGKIVLDAPKVMKVGDIRPVYANVGINVPIERLRKHSRPGDQSQEDTLKVSNEMTATLTGEGFTITRTAPEQQGVAEGFPTVWSWNIEAKQEGEQELEATLYAIIPSGDKSTQQRVDSYTHRIGVSVKEQSWADWIKSSKDELDAVKAIVLTLGGAFTGVLGWLGWSYSRRQTGPEKPKQARRKRHTNQRVGRRARQA